MARVAVTHCMEEMCSGAGTKPLLVGLQGGLSTTVTGRTPSVGWRRAPGPAWLGSQLCLGGGLFQTVSVPPSTSAACVPGTPHRAPEITGVSAIVTTAVCGGQGRVSANCPLPPQPGTCVSSRLHTDGFYPPAANSRTGQTLGVPCSAPHSLHLLLCCSPRAAAGHQWV